MGNIELGVNLIMFMSVRNSIPRNALVAVACALFPSGLCASVAEGPDSATGKRAGAAEKPAIVGTWNLMVESQLGNNPRELVIKPDMTGTYGGGDFAAFPISNLKVEGDIVTMDVTLNVQDTELPSKITLKLAGDKVSGTLDYGQGEATIVGKRE